MISGECRKVADLSSRKPIEVSFGKIYHPGEALLYLTGKSWARISGVPIYVNFLLQVKSKQGLRPLVQEINWPWSLTENYIRQFLLLYVIITRLQIRRYYSLLLLNDWYNFQTDLYTCNLWQLLKKYPTISPCGCKNSVANYINPYVSMLLYRDQFVFQFCVFVWFLSLTNYRYLLLVWLIFAYII